MGVTATSLSVADSALPDCKGTLTYNQQVKVNIKPAVTVTTTETGTKQVCSEDTSVPLIYRVNSGAAATDLTITAVAKASETATEVLGTVTCSMTTPLANPGELAGPGRSMVVIWGTDSSNHIPCLQTVTCIRGRGMHAWPARLGQLKAVASALPVAGCNGFNWFWCFTPPEW